MTDLDSSLQPPPRPGDPPPGPAGKWAAFNSSVDWPGRQGTAVRRLLNHLERISLALEKPINRLVREPQFNPLYHTGTITLFLLLVILITGIFLTMWYQFGWEASYQAVARIEAHPIGRVVRALHRYASALALFAALLHGWRTFFMDRFRGPRWLAWVTGVVMAAFVWMAGVTGYWLISDERAQVLNQTLINILKDSPAGVSFLAKNLVTGQAGSGWLFILLTLIVHLVLSVLIGLFFWWHIIRLKRAKILPPRYWLAVLSIILVLGSVLVPAGMLPPLNPAQQPGEITIDLFYLAYLPAALNLPPAQFWGVTLLLLLLSIAIPWLLVRKPLPPIVVHDDRCTGCTLCAADCPYRAIEMVERSDGKPHKYVARVIPNRCVACGVCIGSCDPLALTLGQQPPEPLWQDTIARAALAADRPIKVVFTCERHAFQGARAFLHPAGQAGGSNGGDPAAPRVEVVPLTCIAMAHPNLAVEALKAGAAEVQFVGCPPEDCANREGNLWQQLRLDRTRLPRLKRAFAAAPIATDWLPPNDFQRALEPIPSQTRATTYDFRLTGASWRRFIPGLLLLAAVMAATVLLTDVPFTPYPDPQAQVEITLEHRAGYPLRGIATEVDPAPGTVVATRIVLEVDGEPLLDQTYDPVDDGLAAALGFAQVSVAPGDRHLRLLMADRDNAAEVQVLADQALTLQPGQIVRFELQDARLGADPVAGRQLYEDRSGGTNTGCRVCHALEPGVDRVGPSLAGIATRAATRVPGLSAEDYLRQSIVDPDAYVVEGFPPGLMVPTLAELLTEEQIDDLVAFMLTLD